MSYYKNMELNRFISFSYITFGLKMCQCFVQSLAILTSHYLLDGCIVRSIQFGIYYYISASDKAGTKPTAWDIRAMYQWFLLSHFSQILVPFVVYLLVLFALHVQTGLTMLCKMVHVDLDTIGIHRTCRVLVWFVVQFLLIHIFP